jgi:adenylate kinase
MSSHESNPDTLEESGAERIGPAIVLIGPPGAGKGTQARRLSVRYGLPHISTGDILRKIARSDSPLAHEIRATQAEGGLVSDDVMAHLVAERLAEPDCSAGYILDGYPRTTAQARALEAIAGARRPVALAIVLPPDEIVRRLTARRTCPVCGEIYNMRTNPPRADEVCDRDGAPLSHRSDDTEEAVRARIEAYESTTLPVLAYYAERGRLAEVDGGADPDRVFAGLGDALDAAR